MNSTEIALLLHKNSEKITRIGEVIGKKIPEKDAFENRIWLIWYSANRQKVCFELPDLLNEIRNEQI